MMRKCNSSGSTNRRSPSEYFQFYGLRLRSRAGQPHVIVMPRPINCGRELSSEADRSAQ
jgi:hypothetical protein